MTCHAVGVTETACPDCVDAAACVDAVLPEGWRRDIHARTGLWPLGVIGQRAHLLEQSGRIMPFSAVDVPPILEEQGVEPAPSRRIAVAAWWALRLAGRDTSSYAVQRLAERAAAYRVGFLAGQLQPAAAV